MSDADPRTSKQILAHALLSATLSFAASLRDCGPRRAAATFALGIGLPAMGELLVTWPLGLLRHRTRPRIVGVPIAILLDWYCVINGSAALTEGFLDRLSLDEATKRKVLPVAAALIGTSLDLILDPFGLDAGLWEWKINGAYAPEIRGANGHSGVPLINYLGWLALVASAVFAQERASGEKSRSSRLPALLLLPYYLAAVVWALRRRKYRYLIYSSPFPVALYAALKKA